MRFQDLVTASCLIFTFLIASAASAQPQQYQTILELQEPVVNSQGVNQLIWRWSTFVPDGLVIEDDLEDLILVVVIDGRRVYQDNVILNGIVQPFEGQARMPETDYFWDFDLDTLLLDQMVNVGEALLRASTGEHYGINDSVAISVDNIVDVRQFVDGETQDGASDLLQTQSTELMVFYDGFERGDLTAWSSTSP